MKRLFPPLSYLSVPNLMTTASVALGMLTLWLVATGRPGAAALCYLVVLLSDRLDGVVARKLKQTSEFGKQLDSLADLLNFCALPAVAAWTLGARAPWQMALLAAYVLAGVWRLAYYNLHELDMASGKPCFVGVCTTHAGALLLAISSLAAVAGLAVQLVAPVAAGAFAVLMVSGLRVPKNGLFTLSLYLLTPASVLAMVLRSTP